MSESLTRAMHSISVAKIYLEDVIRQYPGMERRVNSWIGKLSFVSSDAIATMTPAGREAYRREITNQKDPLLFEHLFRLFCEMTLEQRSLIEKSAEALLKGELEITEQ